MPLPYSEVAIIKALGLVMHPEGSYFVESYRSGSKPMTTDGCTDLNCRQKPQNLFFAPTANDWHSRSPEAKAHRNPLSSIYYVPTKSAPQQCLVKNMSDHIHFYQGGRPFNYNLYDPVNCKLHRYVIGPDLDAGQILQLPVPGGFWKCGHLQSDEEVKDETLRPYEYIILSEAVGPAFDFHDFECMTAEEVHEGCPDDETRKFLLNFVHEHAQQTKSPEAMVEYASAFYRAYWRKAFLRLVVLNRLRSRKRTLQS